MNSSAETQIRLVDSPDGVLLDQVEALFVQMYEYMEMHGLKKPLAEGGEKKWRLGLERTLGKLGSLVVALQDNTVVGFTRGVIRLSPDHLQQAKIGFVDHTFVSENHRRKGIGRAMFGELQSWFESKKVTHIELQVLSGNLDAINVWKALGFEPELLQMTRRLA